MSEQAASGKTTPPSTGKATPHAPVRRSIASFQNYSDAEAAVDALSDRGFPVERVAIAGHDLELIEEVTGRLDYPRAALRGAGGGAATGALIGWLFGLLSWINPLISALLLAVYGLIFGAIVGAALGLLIHAMQHGRRDFASRTFMRPQRYDIVVDEAVADEAMRVLGWDA
jgi:hypothetical protein